MSITGFPVYRPRRTRATENLRAMIRETEVSVKDLIYPLFVVPGENVKHEIESLPGNYHWSIDRVMECVDEVVELGISAVLLFGVPSYKDAVGSSGWDMNEPVQQACKLIKAKYPELVIITDVCLCEYTEHGHCGVLQNGCTVNNDETLPLLAKVAVSHAQAGADMIAPSNMMDGYVKAIREALDAAGFNHIPIMAYSAKFASAYYGPFRAAADSAPSAGDRKGYQPTVMRLCVRLLWISKRALTSLWLSLRWPSSTLYNAYTKPSTARCAFIMSAANMLWSRQLQKKAGLTKNASLWKPCWASSAPVQK